MSYYGSNPYGYYWATPSPGHVLVPASSDGSQDGSESNEVQATESDGNEHIESTGTPSTPPNMLHPWPMNTFADWGAPGNQEGAGDDYSNYSQEIESPTFPSFTTEDRDKEMARWREEPSTSYEHPAHTQQEMQLGSPIQLDTQQQSAGYGYGYHSSHTEYTQESEPPTSPSFNTTDRDDEMARWREESSTSYEHPAHTQQEMQLGSPIQLDTQQQSAGYGYGYYNF